MPTYLADDIHLVSEDNRRSLRSSSDNTCAVPCTCLTRPRCFVTFYISALEILLLTYLLTYLLVCGFAAWSNLPEGISSHSVYSSCSKIRSSSGVWAEVTIAIHILTMFTMWSSVCHSHLWALWFMRLWDFWLCSCATFHVIHCVFSDNLFVFT